ncbi:hypothetical protein ACS0TY_024402 [Phlomoides rotata]
MKKTIHPTDGGNAQLYNIGLFFAVISGSLWVVVLCIHTRPNEEVIWSNRVKALSRSFKLCVENACYVNGQAPTREGGHDRSSVAAISVYFGYGILPHGSLNYISRLCIRVTEMFGSFRWNLY